MQDVPLTERIQRVLPHIRAAGSIEKFDASALGEDAWIADPIALLFYEPERAQDAFRDLEKRFPEEAALCGRTAILEFYAAYKTDGIYRRLKALPRTFVEQIAKQDGLTNELRWFLNTYLEQTK